MSYSTTRPPSLIAGGGLGSGGVQLWHLDLGADSWVDVCNATDADTPWITNAKLLGMKVDDIVFVKGAAAGPPFNEARPRVCLLHVETITASGGAMLK